MGDETSLEEGDRVDARGPVLCRRPGPAYDAFAQDALGAEKAQATYAEPVKAWNDTMMKSIADANKATLDVLKQNMGTHR